MNKAPTTFNHVIYFLLFYFLTAFQTSFWFQWFGNFPAPLFWIILMTYIVLYRSFWTSLLLNYIFAVALSTMSANSIGFMVLNIFSVYAILSYLKSRVFWPGYRYFLIASILSLVSYNIINLLMIRWVDGEITHFNILMRVGQILISSIFIFPLYTAFSWIDLMTMKDTKANEIKGVEL